MRRYTRKPIPKIFTTTSSKRTQTIKEEPVEISEEKVLGTKFSMSIQTIIGLVSLISVVSVVITWTSEIEDSKQLPVINIEEILRMNIHQNLMVTTLSVLQYKNQVGGLG